MQEDWAFVGHLYNPKLVGFVSIRPWATSQYRWELVKYSCDNGDTPVVNPVGTLMADGVAPTFQGAFEKARKVAREFLDKPKDESFVTSEPYEVVWRDFHAKKQKESK